MNKEMHKLISFFIVAAFVFIVFFGMNAGMDMRQDGTMTGCAFNQSAVCPMGFIEHISQWQQSFTATQPTQSAFLILLMIILGASIVSAIRARFCNCCYEPETFYRKAFQERNAIAKIFNHFLQALSDGILNPKIYNLSSVTC